MFTIFAKITPKPEFFEEAKQAILEIISQTRSEPGCKIFNLHILVQENGTKSLCLYEIFESQRDYEYHHAQNYTKKVFEAYKQWLATPVEINKLELIQQK